MKKYAYIVTGGAGLIGSNLVAALNARGKQDILIVDNLNHPAKETNLARLHFSDYMDKLDFRAAIQNDKIAPPGTLFHLGACSATTETNKAYLDSNNLEYTKELCLWSLANQVRFVYASSAATYGDGEHGYRDDEKQLDVLRPLNLYGQSKHDFDLWARDKGYLDRIVGLKYFNVYGPGEDHKGEMRSVVHKAWHQIRETGELKLFRSHRPEYKDGCQQRDFLYVDDAVAITLFFHDHPDVAGLFNAGTGTPHTWLDLANAIFLAMGRSPNIQFIDIPEHLRDKYQYFTLADINKLQKAGHGTPCTPLQDAVSRYVNIMEERAQKP